MSTVDRTVLQQTSDEDLARQFLALSNSGKRGCQAYQCIEAEMRARSLIHRETRLSPSYTGSNSSRFDARPMLFAGSSFR
jgi:hypothetical protein